MSMCSKIIGALVVILIGFVATFAIARSEGLYNPKSNSVGDFQGIDSNKASGGPAFQGVGDIVSGASAYYGMRAYTAAYATSNGNIADIVDTATGTFACTIKAKTNGDADLTSLLCTGATLSVTTFCTVTHAAGCSVTKLYDQTGNTAGMTQATLANMPTLALSATSTSKPAVTFAAVGSQVMGGTLAASLSQPFTISTDARRTANFTTQQGIFAGGTAFFLDFKNVAAQLDFFCGTDTAVTSIDSAFIAIQAVGNGAASTVAVNSNSAVTVSAGAGATGTAVVMGRDGFSSFLTGNVAEIAIWSGAVSSGSLSSNQQTYWGS